MSLIVIFFPLTFPFFSFNYYYILEAFIVVFGVVNNLSVDYCFIDFVSIKFCAVIAALFFCYKNVSGLKSVIKVNQKREEASYKKD